MRPLPLPIGTQCKCKKKDGGTKELSLAHALSCPLLSERFRRDYAFVDDIHRWLRKRRVHVEKEMYVSDEGDERIDLWVWADSVVKWCDVTVTDPSRESVMNAAAKSAGAAVRLAESKKRSKWRDLAAAAGAEVVPLAFETTGHRGESLDKFLREMEAGSSEGPSRASLLNQLSVTMQKRNVAMVKQATQQAMGVRLCKRRLAQQWQL